VSIISILNQVESKEIVLPAIQRDFVWDENRITKLLDSIMRGYPIGIALLWETYNDIQYRNFDKINSGSKIHSFKDNTKKNKLKLVLDGQQRLSSLYIALYGSLNNKNLYFNVLSGVETEDFSEEKYYFFFGSSREVQDWNLEAIEQYQKLEIGQVPEYYISVNDLFLMSAKDKQKERESITKITNLKDDDRLRLEVNISLLDEVLTKKEDILRMTVIDENLPQGSCDRKNESDILEIFVRINTEGVSLNRSDLIFSMLKLNWKESAVNLPDFVEKINSRASFHIDNDFVIRTLFVVSDLGSKFDINILRKQKNVEAIKNNYEKCCSAIASTIDFVQRECFIGNSKMLGGLLNLIPIIYYVYHMKGFQVPNSEIEKVRKSIMFFAYTRCFSRYADSRIGRIVKNELKAAIDSGSKELPYSKIIALLKYWENIESFNERLISNNVLLSLCLVQGISNSETIYKNNSPEIDHIFPKSKLQESGKYEESEINTIGNYWLLSKNKNQNKSNKHPNEYFADVPDTEMNKAHIDRSMLKYPHYRAFINEREMVLLTAIKKKLNIKDDEFILEKA